jgi:hypothetical protein
MDYNDQTIFQKADAVEQSMGNGVDLEDIFNNTWNLHTRQMETTCGEYGIRTIHLEQPL